VMNKSGALYKVIILLVISIISNSAFGQKESAIWYFGRNAGLDFRSHWPLPLTDGQTNTPEGVASVADSIGNLLFYTDGMTIWNKNHGVMASGLSGDSTSTHAATIIPSRTNPNKYFVFTTKPIKDPESDNYGGNYYVVDFSSDPLGEVIYDNAGQSGEPGILKNSTEKFAAIPFLDQTDTSSKPAWYLMMHEFETDTFAIYKFDSLIYDKRRHAVGSAHMDTIYGNGIGASGQVKVSLQGDRIALAIEGENRFEVYNFDKQTGALSNPLILPAGDKIIGKDKFIHRAYGIEFSPNGRYVFGSCSDAGILYRWDLNARPYDAMIQQVYFVSYDLEVEYGALQLAPNGKIYVARQGFDYLSVINTPNNSDYRFEEFGARLVDNEKEMGGLSELGLPVQIPGSIRNEAFYYFGTCLGEQTSFYITNPSTLRSAFFAVYKWGTSQQLFNITGRYDPVSQGTVYEHYFTEPGEYKVVLTALSGGSVVQYTRKLTIHEPPPKVWPQDTVICKGSQLNIDAGDGAFYYWVNAEASDRHLLVDSLGMNPATGQEYLSKEFRVAVTHYNGCVQWDTLKVLRKFPPVLTWESTDAKCNEHNGTATVIPNGSLDRFIYRWVDFPDETSNTITGVGGGIYGVYVSSIETSCEAYIEIPVNAQGSVRIIPSVDTLICPGTEVTLTAENADFIDWIIPEGSTERQVKVRPEVTTTYMVRGISTDGEGGVCETTDQYVVEVAPQNVPDLGDDRSACYGETISIDGPEGYLDWTWNTGDTGRSIQLSHNMDPLILYVTDTNYCSFSDDISVIFYSAPNVVTTTEKALCGMQNGTASVVPLGNPDDFTYIWEDFPDNETNKIWDVGAGVYPVQVTSIITGCDTLVEIVVEEFGAPDTKIISSVVGPACPGTPITLTASNADSYIWINPEGSRDEEIIVHPYVETTYTVMGVSRDDQGNECRAYADITIEVLPYNKPDIGPDLEACEGDTLSISGEESFIDWSWSNGLSGMTVQITESIPELILTATDVNQCVAFDTIGIVFHPYPEVYLGEDQTLCTNEPVVLQGGTGDNYLWSTGETSPSISILEKGNYWLEISTAGCASRDSVFIQLVNPDSIRIDSVTVRDISCFGEVDGEIFIYAHGSGDSYTYSIDEGLNYFDNGGHFENLPAGDDYRVKVLEDSVCARSYDLPLTLIEPRGIDTDYQLTSPSCASCLDGRIEITLLEGGSPPFSILWDNFETGLKRTDIGTGSYSVTITDSRGCNVFLPFELDLRYRIPNAFTPNGDGVNDLWTIGVIEYHPDAIVQIYDSRGKLVFDSPKGYPEPWDGKYQGEYLPMGTYYYIIHLNDTDKPLTGNITLIR